MTPKVDYYQKAARDARAFRDRVVVHTSCVRVGLTVLGPDNVTRVPCGEADFPRCEADVFEGGILTITAQDDGFVMREYQPGQWTGATSYSPDGHICYHLQPNAPVVQSRKSA